MERQHGTHGKAASTRLARWLIPALLVAVSLLLPEQGNTHLRAQSATVTASTAMPARTPGTSTPGATGTPGDTRPNIIMLMADDETSTDMQFMPKVRHLLGDEGVTFTNSFVSYPLCCPSRTTFLTGQYTHNHGVWANLPVREGYQQFEHQNTAFPDALAAAGYTTFHVGKYLNGYGRDNPTQIPPGWDDWHGSIDPSTYRYYGFELNNNGVLKTYPAKPKYYSTDVFTDLATDFIQQQAGSNRPFFLNLDYLAPHSGGGPTDIPGVMAPPPGVPETVACPPKHPSRALQLHRALYPRTKCQNGKTRRPVTDGFAVPPPRYVDAFKDQPLPKGPSFNESDTSDKPSFMRKSSDFPRLTDDEIQTVTTVYRQRLASLLGIEDSVERIVQTLTDTNQLDNTLIIYTSDHGYFLGQHRIPFGKYWPYEEALRVPLIMRGPGLPHDVVRSSTVINVDLAPTILAMAHVAALRRMDGRSLVRMMRDPSVHWNRDVLLEGKTGGAIPYEGVLTSRYSYVEYETGDRELYDLKSDPYELRNLAKKPGYRALRASLHRKLERLQVCSGADCGQ